MFAQTRSLSLAAILVAAAVPTFSGQALATSHCGAHADIAKVLGSKYNESRRVMGVVNARAVMEMFMSPEGTWTMLVTDTSGNSCITAAGEAWQDVVTPVAGRDS
ncbi:MAG: hypothetical protein HY245_15680 [Rhizobiales bacterium]|nr:hypothetical protein [Hyphomicrobiales bacterium]MBI3674826.1 hypothetical protein [Hyphomicrobiales bacterium]